MLKAKIMKKVLVRITSSKYFLKTYQKRKVNYRVAKFVRLMVSINDVRGSL